VSFQLTIKNSLLKINKPWKKIPSIDKIDGIDKESWMIYLFL